MWSVQQQYWQILSSFLLRLCCPCSCADLIVHLAILWAELETGLSCRNSQDIMTGVCLSCFTLQLQNTPCFMNWWIKFTCELSVQKAWLQSPSQEEEWKNQAFESLGFNPSQSFPAVFDTQVPLFAILLCFVYSATWGSVWWWIYFSSTSKKYLLFPVVALGGRGYVISYRFKGRTR